MEITIDQQIYLDYIVRRLQSKRSPYEAPPYPYELFRQMWNDRVYAIEQGNQVNIDSITFLLGDSQYNFYGSIAKVELPDDLDLFE